MQNAITIRRAGDLKYVTDKHDIIYFGNEFCQWLMPKVADLLKVRAFCNESGKALTLVTPWVTDSGIDSVRKLLESYLKTEGRLEVVVNDLGVLKLMSDEFKGRADIIAGRLFSNQRRDPRTLSFNDFNSKDNSKGNRNDNCNELYDHYRQSSFDYQPFIDFLRGFFVARVELDNLLQGIKIPQVTGVAFSLHYPYNVVTIARNCAFSYDKDNVSPWNNKDKCMKKCINASLDLKSEEIEETLIMKGTAIFVKNEIIDIGKNSLIDRLVYSPEIPI